MFASVTSCGDAEPTLLFSKQSLTPIRLVGSPVRVIRLGRSTSHAISGRGNYLLSSHMPIRRVGTPELTKTLNREMLESQTVELKAGIASGRVFMINTRLNESYYTPGSYSSL